MATLEKIRSKSVLLVSVIFVALFLFIITIIDNPMSLFVDQTTVVNVNGEKVDYEKYQERANLVRENNPQATDADNQALQSLITESLMNQEFKKLGITVTPEEISSLLVGANANPAVVNQFVRSFGAGPEEVLAAINDPAASGLSEEQVAQLRHFYVNFENNLEAQLKSEKLMGLIYGTINANKLDAKAMYDEGNTTYTLATVSKSLYDTTDTVTPAEIEKYYNDHKEQYSIRGAFGINEPKRYIKYVTLDIAPSGRDQQKAVQTANADLARIAEAEKMNALVGNSAYIIEHQTKTADELSKENIAGLQEFLSSAAPGDAQIVGGNSAYAPVNPRVIIARLIGHDTRVNGAQIAQIALDGTVNPDSILAQLNAGIAADSIKGIAQVAPMQAMKFADMDQTIADSLRNAGVGKYVRLGNGIAGIGSLDEPQETYEYYTAVYNIEPSRETIDGLNTRMREFLISAPNAEAFNNENAAAQGLMVRESLVGASDPTIDNLEDSRSMIAWAMDAKKGEVSRLYTDSKNTRLSAVAVVDEYKDYITTSFPSLKAGVGMDAQQEKTANNLIAEYSGKGTTMADYQKAMNAARVDTMRGVNFSNGRYGTLSGARAHKKGDVVGPLRWNTAVVVYSVVDATEGTMPFDEASSSAQFRTAAQRTVIGRDINALLLGNGKIDNRILKFTRQ